jgi:hypothetical protein
VRWLLVAALVLTGGEAFAQHASAHVTISGDVAATDNALSSEMNPEADVYYQLRPGLLFAYDAPRQMHELTIEMEVLQYLRHSVAASLTGRAGWRALFLPGPRSEVVAQVNGGTGQLNAITARNSPDQTVVALVPPGAVDVTTADANEYGSYTYSPEIRLTQTLIGRYSKTSDTMDTNTQSSDYGGGVGFEYAWKHTALTIEGGVDVLRFERIAPMVAAGPDGSRLDHQVNPHGVVSLRHDLSRYWSASISGGVQLVEPYGTDPYNPGTTRTSGLFPIVGGSVNYSDIWGRLTISGGRSVSPNLYIAQNTLTTNGLVQLALPLPFLDDSRRREPKLVALGTIGYERTSLIDTGTGTDMTAATFDVYHADVGLGYMLRPGMQLGLRYEFIKQTGDTEATAVIAGFTRNTLFFTMAIRYPDRLAVKIPKRENAVRADRKDLAPIGEEIVVPENPNESDR